MTEGRVNRRRAAARRSPDSYIAGRIAINRQGPRFSEDVDIFHGSAERQDAAVAADEAALRASGYTIAWPPRQRTGKHQATIAKDGEQTLLEWVTDPAFRFFLTQPDPLFGYVLHLVDLAANKASAAADRRVPRDIVDLVTIHETILPLGAAVAAAVDKFPGTTPEDMLAEITRHSRFTAEEFNAPATEHRGRPAALCRKREVIGGPHDPPATPLGQHKKIVVTGHQDIGVGSQREFQVFVILGIAAVGDGDRRVEPNGVRQE